VHRFGLPILFLLKKVKVKQYSRLGDFNSGFFSTKKRNNCSSFHITLYYPLMKSAKTDNKPSPGSWQDIPVQRIGVAQHPQR
jgi:hypothetical protein